MAKKKSKCILSDQERLTRKLIPIVNKWGKVRVTFMHKSIYYNYLPLSQRDLRRRVITKTGKCEVAYRSAGYRRYSSYDESCFMDDYYENGDPYNDRMVKQTLRNTLLLMQSHDEFLDLRCVLIEYGKRFKNKIKLKS